MFNSAAGQEIPTTGVQVPRNPFRGFIKINSDTVLPGQHVDDKW